MSRAIKGQMTSGKGFFGDLISSVAQPLLSIGGAALGGPIGGILGGGLGSAISPLAKRLPFQQGGVLMMAPKKGKKKATKKAKGMVKGSKEAKLKMARLRAMRK
jgi:hypothetical protein